MAKSAQHYVYIKENNEKSTRLHVNIWVLQLQCTYIAIYIAFYSTTKSVTDNQFSAAISEKHCKI